MKLAKTLTILTSCLLVPVLTEASTEYGTDMEALEKSRHRNEATGVLGGAVIGGILAGPPGAIGFAMIGALISDNHSSQRELQAADDSLSALGQDFDALQQQNRNLELAYSSLEQQAYAKSETGPECCFDTGLVLHFKTSSSDIEPHYKEELQHFAALVKANPEAVISLTGYADQRGESTANMNLSRERLAAVEDLLEEMGLDQTVLQSTAYGESKPLNSDNNPEGLFFDRRVVIEAMTPGNGSLTHVPE